MKPDTWLESIALHNYRCFRDLTVTMDPELTVLVARNAAGKTTVLDAIAVSLSAFVGGFHSGRRVGIDRDDVFLEVLDRTVLQMEPQFPCAISCRGHFLGREALWERLMMTPHSFNTFKEAKPLMAIAEDLQQAVTDEARNRDVVLPVIAYYGTGRLWNTKKLTERKQIEPLLSRTVGYLDCLDPASSYKYFVDWFRYTTKAHNELRDRNIELYGERGLHMTTPYQELLTGVARAVEDCLSPTGWRALRYSSIHQAPVVEHRQHGELRVDQLSDGIRNMIAMVADIAYRAASLNPQMRADAPRRSPGIVLIDEVDMHLHPEWQQQVLHLLRKAFPALQFIVTTHSPQVLSAIPKHQVRLLSVDGEGAGLAAVPLAESYARSNADVLETVMHTSPMPRVAETDTLARYRGLAEQGDLRSEELSALRAELEWRLGADHPELLRIAAIIRRRELLG